MGTSGSRREWRDLVTWGENCGLNRVARLMRSERLADFTYIWSHDSRQESYAVVPNVRICAGGRATSVPTAIAPITLEPNQRSGVQAPTDAMVTARRGHQERSCYSASRMVFATIRGID